MQIDFLVYANHFGPAKVSLLQGNLMGTDNVPKIRPGNEHLLSFLLLVFSCCDMVLEVQVNF